MLNTLPLSGYGGQEITCACGETHKIETENIAFGSKTSCGIKFAVEKIVPAGSAIFFIADENGEEFLPLVSKNLARAGYRISKFIASADSRIGLHPFVGTNKSLAKELALAEDVRLIIGAGGGQATELAKLLAAEKNLPLIILAAVPDYPLFLAPFVIVDNGIQKIFPCPPPDVLIADTDWLSTTSKDRVIAAGFGELMSKLIALFDREVSSLVEGGKHCSFISEQTLALIDSCQEKMDSSSYSAAERAAIILEHSLRFSALFQLSNDFSLIGGGESQTENCLSLLLQMEERQQRKSGENRFILASVISKIYINTLENLEEIGFTPPPDNNLRIEAAREYLGIQSGELLGRLRRYTAKKQAIEDYKLREFRQDLLNILRSYEKKLARATKTFKRLYDDCGYSLLGYLDHTDLSLCLALAPDLRENFTFLTQMKNMGLLDRYII